MKTTLGVTVDAEVLVKFDDAISRQGIKNRSLMIQRLMELYSEKFTYSKKGGNDATKNTPPNEKG